jgi:hypothetical protein
MSTSVQVNSHRTTRNRQGTTATLTWICDWADAASVRPKIGAAHPTESGIYCSEVMEEGVGVPTGTHTYTKLKITATYGSYQWLDSAPQTTWEMGGEVLETGLGRQWQGTRTRCDQAYGIYYPNAVLTITVMRADVPLSHIMTRLGKVNWSPFQGCPRETVLFEGCTTESQYDYERHKYFYRISYRFLVRPGSHNVVWRAPRQARDDTGALLTTGEPEYDPVFVNTAAGVGGWDRPLPWLYDWADFNPLLGLPASPPPSTYLSPDVPTGSVAATHGLPVVGGW